MTHAHANLPRAALARHRRRRLLIAFGAGLAAMHGADVSAQAARPENPPPAPASRGAPDAMASGLPAQAALVYRSSGTFHLAGMPMTLHARTTTDWRLRGGRYEAHLHIDTVGFDQRSSGRLGPGGELRPESYVETRPFHDPEAVRVDWAAPLAHFAGASPPLAPAAGAQDRLSLQFELARRLRLRPADFAAGERHAVAIIGVHDIDPWDLEIAGEESLETGLGRLAARRCTARREIKGTVETLDIWLGPTQAGLPLRIRMVDRNQAVIDSVLAQVQFSATEG